MSLFEVGRLCVKIAGRDAGNKCIIVEELGNGYVLIDGCVRRKKANIKHLEPLAEVIKIREKAADEEVKAAFEQLGLQVWKKKSKAATERPKRQKKKKEAGAEGAKKEGKKKYQFWKREGKAGEEIKSDDKSDDTNKEEKPTELEKELGA
ncbi:MAG: 50S ribosomal protein L14e [Nanoarchaeota archaeon]